MRQNLPKMIVALLLLWPGISAAAEVDSAAGSADCNGWTADVQVTFNFDAFFAKLDILIVLTDADNVEVERVAAAEYLSPVPGQTINYPYTGTWAGELDGNYQMTASFTLTDFVAGGILVSSAGFSTDFTCGEPVVEDPVVYDCVYGRDWWVANPEAWPVTTLSLGGVQYEQPELLALMGGRRHGNITLLVARQLITTKLNLAAGSDGWIGPVVDQADSYVGMHGLTSRPLGRERVLGIKLALDLQSYNRQGCPDGTKVPAFDVDQEDLKSLEKEFVAEPLTFGAVKSMFR